MNNNIIVKKYYFNFFFLNRVLIAKKKINLNFWKISRTYYKNFARVQMASEDGKYDGIFMSVI